MEETTMSRRTARSFLQRLGTAALMAGAAALAPVPIALADETCNSPFMSNLIKGQEDYVYVWTLGIEGLGNGSASW
jgi:selenium-binding protein 1